MSANYSPGLPVDRYGNTKTDYPPAKIALASTTKENAATSSILLLTHDTTEIEVNCVSSVGGTTSGNGVAGKWLTQAVVDSSVAGTSVITAAGTSNYDFIVQAGYFRRFVVPVGSFNQAQQSVQGVNRALGLYPAVALKSLVGSASVLTMEF